MVKQSKTFLLEYRKLLLMATAESLKLYAKTKNIFFLDKAKYFGKISNNIKNLTN